MEPQDEDQRIKKKLPTPQGVGSYLVSYLIKNYDKYSNVKYKA